MPKSSKTSNQTLNAMAVVSKLNVTTHKGDNCYVLHGIEEETGEWFVVHTDILQTRCELAKLMQLDLCDIYRGNCILAMLKLAGLKLLTRSSCASII